MNNKELMHHGVKGMKWGVRKKKPTVTKASEHVKTKEKEKAEKPKNNKGSEYVKTKAKNKVEPPKDEKAKVEETKTENKVPNKSHDDKLDKEIHKLDAGSKVAGQTAATLGNLNTLNNSVAKIKNKKQTRKEIDSMSNEEMRKKIERLRLEQDYTNLTKDRVTKGHEYVNNGLTLAQNAATVTATSLLIAKYVKELRKK